jgi:hypothetical protein
MKFNSEIIFLGERDHRDPLCRFYFDSLVSQLTSRGVTFRWISPKDDLNALLNLSTQYVINFFYKDIDAINAIMRLNKRQITSICFCSDVENYADYQHAYEVVDVFVCPTLMHQNILRYVYELPIYVLREAIDPILKQVSERKFTSASTNLVWFGFSESYQRSMVNLESVIIEALQKRWINSFTVISSQTIRTSLPPEFHFVEYGDEKFEEQIQLFDFAILSHGPLDLHLNTFIKSPNKAISAIVSGIIPICSDTPNYRWLMDELKLGSYIFHSPGDLLKILQDLPERVVQEDLSSTWHHANGVVRSLYSAESQCDEYFRVLDQISPQNDVIRERKSAGVRFYNPPNADIKFRFYLRQQLGKLRRAFRIEKF